MMPTQPTSPATTVRSSDTGTPAAKDRSRERDDQFLNLLSSFCSAPVMPPPQLAANESPQDCSAPINVSGIEPTGAAELPANDAASVMPTKGTDAFLIQTTAVALPSFTPEPVNPDSSVFQMAEDQPGSELAKESSAPVLKVESTMVPLGSDARETTAISELSSIPLLKTNASDRSSSATETSSAGSMSALQTEAAAQISTASQTAGDLPTDKELLNSRRPNPDGDAPTAGKRTVVRPRPAVPSFLMSGQQTFEAEAGRTPALPAGTAVSAARSLAKQLVTATTGNAVAESTKTSTPLPLNPARLATPVTATDSQTPVINDESQTLQDQAAQRDAGLVAGLLAEAGRLTREANPLLAIRRQFNTRSDAQADNDDQALDVLALGGATKATSEQTLAAIAQESDVDTTANSVAMQSTAKILAVAESLSVRQIRTIRLQLNPLELGQIEIQLKRDAQGKISAHLTASREGTRQVLSQSLGELRTTLERAGLTVDRLHVKAEAGSLRGSGNGNTDNSGSRHRKPQGPTFRSLTNTDTQKRGASRVHDHKLLSLSA